MKTRIKLVHIITDLEVGGAEMMLYRMLLHMNRDQFDPVVVSLMDSGKIGSDITALNIPVYTLGMKQGKPTFAALLHLVQIIRRVKPGIIQSWMHHSNLAAQVLRILSFQRFHVFWCIQNSIHSLANEKKSTAAIIRLSARISHLPTKIIYVSHVSQHQHEQLGYSSAKSQVIPNGTDTSLFMPSLNARLNVRTELGLSQHTPLIGLIARYHPQKDHPNFLRAAALLMKTHPETHFLLAGRAVDWENHALCELVSALGLVEQVHMLGERNDISRLTAALDIATVAAAYGEAFPLSIGEAMSCGVPCVVTDVGDAPIVVDDTGSIVPPRDASALAEAWCRLLDAGAEQRHAIGQRARQRILDHYAIERVVQAYEDLYISAVCSSSIR